MSDTQRRTNPRRRKLIRSHMKERQPFTGTVLTPDGTHYRIQFDRHKHGVQLVKDLWVMPLLDGSRKSHTTPDHT